MLKTLCCRPSLSFPFLYFVNFVYTTLTHERILKVLLLQVKDESKLVHHRFKNTMLHIIHTDTVTYASGGGWLAIVKSPLVDVLLQRFTEEMDSEGLLKECLCLSDSYLKMMTRYCCI